jgi:two-component system sensor histidine kinase MtrB
MSHRRRAGLRTRLTAAFGVGALLLSLSLSVLTYELVRNYLLGQRQTASVREAYANARLLEAALQGGQGDVSTSLASVATGPGTESVVRQTGSWYSTSLAVGSQALPVDLRKQADLGKPATQRFRLAGSPRLAVEVPLPSQGATYFEVFSLSELDRTLRALLAFLAIGAGAISIAGVVAGRWASRRVLVPLSDVATVAADIAGGHFEARLDVGADRDLSQLAASFNSMVDALKTRVERDARFASDVSHELRSPLTTLSASLEVLRARRAELSAPGREALDLLAGDLQRFQRLVEDLLEISRFDAGAVHANVEAVRVVELVRHSLVRAGVDDQVLRVAPSASVAVARADKRRLERVIVNLVDNATLHGSGVIEVGVEQLDGHVRITVDDHGPGVPAELRARVFERFFRGPAGGPSAGGGVGLGLSLVAEQVHAQDGQVWVEDRPGGGARFVVELPAETS